MQLLVVPMGSWSMAFLFLSDKCCIIDELQLTSDLSNMCAAMAGWNH